MSLHHDLSVKQELQVKLVFEHMFIISRVLDNRQKSDQNATNPGNTGKSTYSQDKMSTQVD